MKMSTTAYKMIKHDMVKETTLIFTHKEWLLEKNNKASFKSLSTRLGWDVYHGIVTKETKDIIRHEDLNDTHITTALCKALKELEIL